MVLFMLILSSLKCFGQEKICFTEGKKYKIDTECDLVVYKQNNDYLFRVVKGGRPYDVAGFNNVESPDDFSPKPVKFLATQKEICYIIEMGVSGSTFGANQFLVIWKGSYGWSLSEVSFVRSLLVDQDGDGLLEFQNVYSPHKGFYKFDDGILVAYVPKTK